MIRTAWLQVTVMLFCMAVTAFTLNRYAALVQHLVNTRYNWQFELWMVTGMLVFQYPFTRKAGWELKLQYYVGMLLVSAMGSVLLMPLLVLNNYTDAGDVCNLAWFFTVVLIMFFVHRQLVTKLNMPGLLSYTWVVYRLLILIYILYL